MRRTYVRGPSPSLLLVLLAVLIVPALAGCATSGGAGGAENPDMTAAPEPAVDVINEVGENGLLTPAAILARWVQALGGEEALRAHTSSTQRGKMSIPAMGVEGEAVMYIAAPAKMSLTVEFGPMGTIYQGYNGEVGWYDSQMTGPILAEGEFLEQFIQQSQFYGPLAYDHIYTTIETVELTEFNGEPAYKLRLVGESGREGFQYFSQQTGLLIGGEGVQTSPMGEQSITTLVGEYKDFGAAKVATKMTVKVSGMEILQTVSEVTYDDVEENAFEPPDSIKALMKQ